MRLKLFLVVALLAGTALLPAMEKMADGVYAEFTTPRGAFVIELHHRQAPMTVANFVGLAEGTLGPKAEQPYYTGLKWYRVIPGFVIQSGNPKAPEDSDTGYSFPDEFVPGLRHPAAGILSMANAGPDTNSGEFFITLGDCTRLNYLHSVFGQLFTGLDVLAQIQPGDPFSIKILRVGEEGRAFKADVAAFKALREKAPAYAGAPEPGPAAHFDDPANLLPVDPPRARNFNYKLANYERATGQRIYARVYPTFTPTEEAKTPPLFAQKLARSLGIHKNGVLAVYFADKDEWYVWLGDDLVASFNPERQRMADVKNALYAAVKAKVAEYTQLARQNRGPDNPLKPADLTKYSVDAMLDLLIFRLEPKP